MYSRLGLKLLSSEHIIKAAEVIRAGGLVAYPTEAVFGLGCDPLNEAALWRLLKLKKRPIDKGLILIAAEFAQLEGYLAPLTPQVRQRLFDSWPGPVTWLVPARHEVPQMLRGNHETIAVRVTAHSTAAALCRQAETAIVSTSANLSGQPAARRFAQVKSYFENQIDFILEGPLGRSHAPSEIRDAISGKIIRSV